LHSIRSAEPPFYFLDVQLEVSYISALETFAMSSLSLQSYLLTDGLEAPSQPGGIDQPVREVNLPLQMGTSPQ
jgi:hypothetical protein